MEAATNTMIVFGMHIKLNDLIRFKFCLMRINEKTEKAINEVCFYNGTESFTIRFLQKNVIISRRDNFVGQFSQIIDFHENYDNEVLHKKHKKQKSCIVLSIKGYARARIR